jgi:hypothetical protein
VAEKKAVFHRCPEPNRYCTVVQSSCWSLDRSQKNAEPQLRQHNWLLMQLQPFAIFVNFVASCPNQFMGVWKTGYELSAVGEALFYCVSKVVEDGVILLYLVARNW